MRKKSQVSFEFISIFVIGFTITLILSGLFFTISSSEKSRLDVQQVTSIGNDLMDYAEQIYFRGSGNKIQYRATFPDRIEYLQIKQFQTSGGENYSELVFGYYNQNGLLTNITFNPSENFITLNCSYSCNAVTAENMSFYNNSDFNSGQKIISIRSVGDQVLLDFVR